MSDDGQRHQWATPDWWKERALAALAEAPRGTKTRAAEAIGCTVSAINQMLSPAGRQSRHALALSDFLGIPRPVEHSDDDLAEWLRLGRELSVENRERLEDIARSLVDKES